MAELTKTQNASKAKAVTRLNWSTLRYLAVSAKLLKWRVEHPEPDTPALRLGRAIHCAILEPKEFGKRWIVAGQCAGITKAGAPCGSQGSLYFEGAWFCRIKGHAPEGAGALPEGVEVLEESGLELVKACALAVSEHKVAARILKGGLAEREIEWTEPETGIACRGRIDYLRPGELVDLKSTAEETVRDFARVVAQRLYYAQLSWYHDGAIAAGKLQPDAQLPALVSVQTSPPHDVAVYRLSRYAFEAGQIFVRDLLLKYRDCLASDTWLGIAPGLIELDLPPWAAGMNGSEYERNSW